jgi:hypothetical protein
MFGLWTYLVSCFVPLAHCVHGTLEKWLCDLTWFFTLLLSWGSGQGERGSGGVLPWPTVLFMIICASRCVDSFFLYYHYKLVMNLFVVLFMIICTSRCVDFFIIIIAMNQSWIFLLFFSWSYAPPDVSTLSFSIIIMNQSWIFLLFFSWSYAPPGVSTFSFTTTKKGHIVIQKSSQTTKKSISENPQFRTTIPHKLLSLCETLTFAPVQSQALRNSRNWNDRKTFPIIMSSIHDLWLTIHRKLFAVNPTSQWFSELTQNSIGFRYNV